jgi:hypothetical protein
MVADNKAYLFAAVKGLESDTFGEGSSGIAILGYTAIKKENEAQEKTYFQQIPVIIIT